MKEGQSFAIRCFWYQKKYNICDQLHTPPCQNLSHLFRIGRKSIINQTDTARERKHNIYIFLLGSAFQKIRFGLDLSLTWTFGTVAMWHQHIESLNLVGLHGTCVQKTTAAYCWFFLDPNPVIALSLSHSVSICFCCYDPGVWKFAQLLLALPAVVSFDSRGFTQHFFTQISESCLSRISFVWVKSE